MEYISLLKPLEAADAPDVPPLPLGHPLLLLVFWSTRRWAGQRLLKSCILAIYVSHSANVKILSSLFLIEMTSAIKAISLRRTGLTIWLVAKKASKYWIA